MREIKFRGKTVTNGEWVCGDLIQYSTEQHKTEKIAIRKVSDWFTQDVLKETVGQYTGLKDKNGVEIFEGDLLDCVDRIVEVYWNEKCGTWDSQFIKYTNVEQMPNGIEVVNWKYRATVIGNIHEVSNETTM